MTTDPSQDGHVYSIPLHKTVVFLLAIPLPAVLFLPVLQYKGQIDVVEFGLQVNHLLYGCSR